MEISLTIGEVQFFQLELPEKIGPFGGSQTLVVHEFPGGGKTVDSLGAFPNTITWSGIFTGPDAFSRAFQLDRMRVTSQVVELNYGPQSFSGKIGRLDYTANHQFFVPYTITFEPIEDLSGIGAIALFPTSPDQSLSTQMNEYDDVVSGDDGLPLPSALTGPAAGLSTTIQVGLQDGDGTVVGIPQSDSRAIQASVAAIESAAAPIIAGTDATMASPALDLAAQAACIGAIIASPQAPARQFNMVNPNLFVVAAMYLGDSSLWEDICEASDLPPDPQPIGMFTVVVPNL